jgi:glucokinase
VRDEVRQLRALGIDIGGTKIAVAALDGSGHIVARQVLPTEAERGFDRAMDRVVAAGDLVLAEAGATRDDLCGIGIGCTGPVSAQRGIINNPYTLPTWVECPIVARLQAVYKLPVFLENDADAAALGETFAGAAQNCNRVVMLTFGTGVGGGAILDGRVYRGVQGEHPELGHIPIDSSGPDCYCGTRGCLEAIASGTAISRAAQEAGMGDSHQVFSRAAGGDERTRAIVARVADSLRIAVWTLLHTFMPEVIVLGGGIMDEHFEKLSARAVHSLGHSTMTPKGSVRIVKARLGNEAGLVGAASLALRAASCVR